MLGDTMTRTLRISPEELAYWYFRLNGCFTIRNFVMHPDEGRRQRTDVDMFAVRLPYRSELLSSPMEDDPQIALNRSRLQVFLAEVKTGACNLNGPWTDPARRNMERAIRAAGAIPLEHVNEAASEMYTKGHYSLNHYSLTMLMAGSIYNPELKQNTLLCLRSSLQICSDSYLTAFRMPRREV